MREAEGDWKGRLYSASAGVSYDVKMGRFSVRPSLSIEHYKLTEKGYEETGGGDAFNLTVEKRTSDETAANALVALGYNLIDGGEDGSWMRVELEGGYRNILSGSLGKTRAHFEGGETFTLTPEDRESGWLAGLRLMGGDRGVVAGRRGQCRGSAWQGRDRRAVQPPARAVEHRRAASRAIPRAPSL